MTTALLVITPEGELYVFHILPGDSLEKQLKKQVSHITTMVTSLKSSSLAHLEFRDDPQLLFMGRDNNQLYSFLKSFKEDIEYRVQKAVKLSCFQEGRYSSYQVNMITQKLTTYVQLEEEKQVEDNFAQRGLFRGEMKKLPNLLASTKQNTPLGEFFAVLEDVYLKVFEK